MTAPIDENMAYLKAFLGKKMYESFILCEKESEKATIEDCSRHKIFKEHLEHMKKYGDNRWWISQNNKVLAYYQTKEPLMLVSLEKYMKALRVLVGHPVYTNQFLEQNVKQLEGEVERAFKIYQSSEECACSS